MKKLPLIAGFFLALTCLFFGTAFFSQFRIWPFSPFLALCFYRVSFKKALWLSFFLGLLMDIFSSQFKFGLFAFDHVLVTAVLYGQKRHFFEDKVIAFSLYTALTSCLLSFFLLILSSLSDRQITVTLSVLLSDLIFMPFLDALYAFFWFICPASLYLFSKKERAP